MRWGFAGKYHIFLHMVKLNRWRKCDFVCIRFFLNHFGTDLFFEMTILGRWRFVNYFHHISTCQHCIHFWILYLISINLKSVRTETFSIITFSRGKKRIEFTEFLLQNCSTFSWYSYCVIVQCTLRLGKFFKTYWYFIRR